MNLVGTDEGIPYICGQDLQNRIPMVRFLGIYLGT